MLSRRKLAVGAAGLAATALIAVPLGVTQGGGSVDVFVGSTPTPTATTTSTPTATPTATPYPTVANVFVDTTTGNNTCVRSSSAAAYDSTKACDSINAAAIAANPHDLILVKAGTYTAQTIADDSSMHTGNCDVGNTADCTIVAPYPGDSVTLADLTNHSWNMYYDGFTFTKTPTTGDPGDGGPSMTEGKWNVMANMNATQFYIASQSSSNPTENAHIYGGTFGPLITCPGGGIPIGVDNATQTWEMPKNVTVEGIYAHDFKITSGCSQDHMDCIHPRQTTGYARYLRNRFYNCQNYAILAEGSPDTASVMTFENNMVGDSIAGPSSLALHGGASTDVFKNVTFANNSTSEGIGPQPNSTINGTLIVANNYASAHNACKTGTYAANKLYGSTTCDASDTASITVPSFTSRATGDMHFSSGTPATGNATYCPATDFDGETRGGTCYVGADQP